ATHSPPPSPLFLLPLTLEPREKLKTSKNAKKKKNLQIMKDKLCNSLALQATAQSPPLLPFPFPFLSSTTQCSP
ncbi:hypothetical protein IscW_ISCW013606, partial [Ixodes scapularis]